MKVTLLLSNSEPLRWVVVRSTSQPIVVNLPDCTCSSGGLSGATTMPITMAADVTDKSQRTTTTPPDRCGPWRQ
jgi:hypothetical protein